MLIYTEGGAAKGQELQQVVHRVGSSNSSSSSLLHMCRTLKQLLHRVLFYPFALCALSNELLSSNMLMMLHFPYTQDALWWSS